MNKRWEDIVSPNLGNVTLCIIATVLLFLFFPTFLLDTSYYGGDDLFGLAIDSLPNDVSVVSVLNLFYIVLAPCLLALINYKYSLFTPVSIIPIFLTIVLLIIITRLDSYNLGSFLSLIEILIILSSFEYSDTVKGKDMFNLGILIVTGSLFYPYFGMTLMPVIMFLYFSNRLSVRAVVGIILGASVVVVYALIAYYLLGVNIGNSWHLTINQPSVIFGSMSSVEKVFLLVIGLYSIYSAFRLSSKFNVMSLKQRGMFTLLFSFFFVNAVLMIFTPDGVTAMCAPIVSLIALFIGEEITMSYEKERWSKYVTNLFFLFLITFSVYECIVE